MKEELTIYNFKNLLNLKDSMCYTRKVAKKVAEKDIVIGKDIFTIRYSLKKGDVIHIKYNGKKKSLKKKKVEELLNTYGISLDLYATEQDYEEKMGYLSDKKVAKEQGSLKDLINLPNTSMLKEHTTKKNTFTMGLAYKGNKEIRYLIDSKTKEIITLEVNGQEIEPTKKNIIKLNEELAKYTNVKDFKVTLDDIHHLKERTLFSVNKDDNTIKCNAVIGKNVIWYTMDKNTKVIKSFAIGEEIFKLDEKTVAKLNIAIDAIIKGEKEQTGRYTINDIETFTTEAIISKKNLSIAEGKLIKGMEISIRVLFEKSTGIIKEIEYNGKLMPVNKNTITLINNSIHQYDAIQSKKESVMK